MVQSKDNSEVNFTIPKIKFTKLFINGEFVDSISGNTFEMIDPRNEDMIARIAEGNKDDIDLAVKAACEAFDNGPWPRLAPKERRKIIQLFAYKVSPTLATGCTMVVKPAKQTPLSALYYAYLAKQTAISDGVINVVKGFGHTTGAELSSYMDVDKISFTGSTEVGRLIMQAGATSNLKSVSRKLEGKLPFIVFDNVDVDKVAPLAFDGKI
ncbi:Aldehyde dehydrogenase family 2 member C4 [Capsicum annuum]|nr:Aldehyde dehydrogenase family 2 member C4 [Capsicum annuum]